MWSLEKFRAVMCLMNFAEYERTKGSNVIDLFICKKGLDKMERTIAAISTPQGNGGIAL